MWNDDLTGGISMPAGETVNAAGLIVGTAHSEHNDVQTIDSSLVANGEIWNSIYNGGMTQYSASSDFTVDEESLQLTSLGYGADLNPAMTAGRLVPNKDSHHLRQIGLTIWAQTTY